MQQEQVAQVQVAGQLQPPPQHCVLAAAPAAGGCSSSSSGQAPDAAGSRSVTANSLLPEAAGAAEEPHIHQTDAACPGGAPVAAAAASGGLVLLPAGQQQQQEQHQHQGLLACLPLELLLEVVRRLPPLDFTRLCCTCKALHAAGTAEGVPAMRLTLFPHQRAALRWMLSRERLHPQPPRHPFVVALPTHEGLPLWADLATGRLLLAPPEPLPQLRGGFFCDEPVRNRGAAGMAGQAWAARGGEGGRCIGRARGGGRSQKCLRTCRRAHACGCGQLSAGTGGDPTRPAAPPPCRAWVRRSPRCQSSSRRAGRCRCHPRGRPSRSRATPRAAAAPFTSRRRSRQVSALRRRRPPFRGGGCDRPAGRRPCSSRCSSRRRRKWVASPSSSRRPRRLLPRPLRGAASAATARPQPETPVVVALRAGRSSAVAATRHRRCGARGGAGGGLGT